MAFWIAIVLIYFSVCIGLIYLAFRIPKKRGKKVLGIFLAVLTALLMFYPILSFYIEDYWFFKSDVIEILSKHGFELKDEFEIESHEISGIMDYYQEFKIEISESDRERLISKIVNSRNYNDTVNLNFDFTHNLPRYSDNENEFYSVNYQTKYSYTFEYYKPNKKGQMPIWEIISIPKEDKILTYQLILD